MSRWDGVRSFVRRAGDRVGSEPVRVLRQLWQDTTRGQSLIGDRKLTSAIARSSGVSSASVTCDAEGVRVDVTPAHGTHFVARLVPLAPCFAPGGAKEVSFRVEPPAAAVHPCAAAVAATIAHQVALSLWGAVIGRGESEAHAIVDRDGDILHIDLRTLTEVRRLISRPRAGLLLDVLQLARLAPEPGGLRLTVRLKA